jgi:ketosteroid isomerase-like protein
MAGSRAASAREPGQIREEAALSDTARAPRISLAGAEGRRARPKTGFREGCTVRLAPMNNAKENLAVARLAVERWNAHDFDGVLKLYAEDAVMQSGPDWPEQAAPRGRDAIRRNMEEWRDVWESSVMEVESIEGFGERIVAAGSWNTRGRASGLDGTMPFVLLLTIRDGKISSLEWFADRDSAVAAARDA